MVFGRTGGCGGSDNNNKKKYIDFTLGQLYFSPHTLKPSKTRMIYFSPKIIM